MVPPFEMEHVIKFMRTAMGLDKKRGRGGDAFAYATRNIFIVGAVRHISNTFGLTPRAAKLQKATVPAALSPRRADGLAQTLLKRAWRRFGRSVTPHSPYDVNGY